MLNINPMNNYSKSNINFKSQKDYSKIYKEMEKITLIQEEKIIPKPNLEKQVEKIFKTTSSLNGQNDLDSRNVLSSKSNPLRKLKEFLFYEENWVTGKMELDELRMAMYGCGVFIIAYAVSMLFLLSHIFSDNKEQSSGNWVTEYVDKVQKIVTGNQNDTEQSFESDNLEKEAFFKADSLENLYKKDLISFDDYKKQMQNIIRDYNAKTLTNVLNENGITLLKPGEKKRNNTYYYDFRGNIRTITNDVSLWRKIERENSGIYENIKTLEQKIHDNEALKNSTESNDNTVNNSIEGNEVSESQMKADSLINLYNNKKITLEELKEKLIK